MRLLMVSNKIKTYPLLYQNIINTLHMLGHNLVWAADFSQLVADRNKIPCTIEQIPINTNPFNWGNWIAYKRLKVIIDQYKIDAVLCSTPIGGTLARLAANRKNVKPVIYEAHGFLFFKGAPLINRTLYKLQEIWLAHYTDVLITITNEDYIAAQKFELRSGRKPYLVHGAGINVGVETDIDRNAKRRELGLENDSCVIISAGELNKNKNTKVVIDALGKLKGQNIHYLVCGIGPEKDNLEALAHKKGVSDQVHLLGYRTDVAELMAVSDIFIMPSFREGVPRSILEAMDLGLPCIGSDTRGIRDLIDKEAGGFICKAADSHAFAEAIKKLAEDKALRMKMGQYNKEKVKPYSSEIVKKELKQIYLDVLK